MTNEDFEKKEKNQPYDADDKVIEGAVQEVSGKSDIDPGLMDGPAYTVAQWFVKYLDKYRQVGKLNTPLSLADAKRLATQKLWAMMPEIVGNRETAKKIVDYAFSGESSNPTRLVANWDGSTRCVPGCWETVIHGDWMATVNTWVRPAYRKLEVTDADMTMLEEFVNRTFAHDEDKGRFLDWLSWVLQNEADKPGWAPILFSRQKRTGKSTLTQVLTKAHRSAPPHCRSAPDDAPLRELGRVSRRSGSEGKDSYHPSQISFFAVFA